MVELANDSDFFSIFKFMIRQAQWVAVFNQRLNRQFFREEGMMITISPI